MTHSEIARLVIDNADLISHILKRGHDCEIRLFPSAKGLKIIEVQKKVLIGCEAVKGDSGGFNALNGKECVESVKAS